MKQRATVGQHDEQSLTTQPRLLILTALNTPIDKADISETTVTLHSDLYVYAYRGSTPGPLTGIDHDAWLLSDYGTAHLNGGKTGSWW